jgi:hypothetical protein
VQRATKFQSFYPTLGIFCIESLLSKQVKNGLKQAKNAVLTPRAALLALLTAIWVCLARFIRRNSWYQVI